MLHVAHSMALSKSGVSAPNSKAGFFRNSQPVVSINWLSAAEFAVATQSSVRIYDIVTSNTISIPGRVWGMVCLQDDELLILEGTETDQELCSLELILRHRPTKVVYERQSPMRLGQLVRQERESPMYTGQLMRPTIVGKEIACITPPSGVQSCSIESQNWPNNPPLLGAATSMAVSLNRNLVVQTKDSIQIFSVDVLTSREVRNDVRPSHVYPLGENHILCVLRQTRHLAVLELETLRELSRDDETFPFRLLLASESGFFHTPFSPAVVAGSDIPMALRAWRSGISLPEQTKIGYEDGPRLLYGLSPARTKMATFCEGELWVHDAKWGDVLAWLPNGDLGVVCDLVFDSETRVYLVVDRSGQHLQIPFDIKGTWLCSHEIIRGEPMPLSERRAVLPYTLDANCEWVLGAQSRRICWISPRDVRRGSGGHFWAGPSLVMVGGDGVVRKVSFKGPEC